MMIIVFMFKTLHLVWTPITTIIPLKRYDDVHVEFEADKEFLNFLLS